jgi:integrase
MMRRFGPTKADKRCAERAAEEINHRLALGLYEPRDEGREGLPFNRAVETWLRDYAPTMKPAYEQLCRALLRNHLEPFFGSQDLQEIHETDLLRFIREKLSAGFAPATIRSCLSVVRRVCTLAVREGTLARNPATHLGELMRRVDQYTASEVRVVDAWSRDEAGILLGLAKEHDSRFYCVLRLLFGTGMRRGEALGLRWEDVDLERGRLYVRRALVRGEPTTPKSGKGRVVALSPGLASELLDLLAQRRRECLARRWPEMPPWVFCSERGGPLEERNLVRSWDRIRRRAQKLGVRPLRLHDCRHSFATWALASGKSIRWVADQLGHHSPTVTLRTYAHAMPDEERDLSFADIEPMTVGDVARRRYTAPVQMAEADEDDKPLKNLVELRGIEPLTLRLPGRNKGRSNGILWRWLRNGLHMAAQRRTGVGPDGLIRPWLRRAVV